MEILFHISNSCSIVCNLVGEASDNIEDNEAHRRAGFVDSLLNVDPTDSIASADSMNRRLQESCQTFDERNENSVACSADFKVKSMLTDLPKIALFLFLLTAHTRRIMYWFSNVQYTYCLNFLLLLIIKHFSGNWSCCISLLRGQGWSRNS